jgi:hypothetical protein
VGGGGGYTIASLLVCTLMSQWMSVIPACIAKIGSFETSMYLECIDFTGAQA